MVLCYKNPRKRTEAMSRFYLRETFFCQYGVGVIRICHFYPWCGSPWAVPSLLQQKSSFNQTPFPYLCWTTQSSEGGWARLGHLSAHTQFHHLRRLGWGQLFPFGFSYGGSYWEGPVLEASSPRHIWAGVVGLQSDGGAPTRWQRVTLCHLGLVPAAGGCELSRGPVGLGSGGVTEGCRGLRAPSVASGRLQE